MKLRIDIVFSIMAHAALLTMAFAIVGRGWPLPVPVAHLTVSLVSGLAEIATPDGRYQKGPRIPAPVPAAADKTVSSRPRYDSEVRSVGPSPDTGRKEEVRVIPAADTGNAEKTDMTGPVEARSGPIGSGQSRVGLSSSSVVAARQGLPAGSAAPGDSGRSQDGDQFKGANTEDGKAIWKAITRVLVYPLFARKRGLEGTALTEFKVNAKGYPEDIRIIRSSGHSILDTAAKDSLLRAAPFMVERGGYYIPITFRLKNK